MRISPIQRSERPFSGAGTAGCSTVRWFHMGMIAKPPRTTRPHVEWTDGIQKHCSTNMATAIAALLSSSDMLWARLRHRRVTRGYWTGNAGLTRSFNRREQQCKGVFVNGEEHRCYFNLHYYITASRKHKYPALNCKLWDICLRQGVITACRAIPRQLVLGLIPTQEGRSQTIMTSGSRSTSGLKRPSHVHCTKGSKSSRQQKKKEAKV